METIKIDEIEVIFLKAIRRMKEVYGNEIELSKDYYWNIPFDKLFDTYEKPNDLTIGQLSEDYDLLKKHLEISNLPNSRHLVKIAHLLRFLGEEKPF